MILAIKVHSLLVPQLTNSIPYTPLSTLRFCKKATPFTFPLHPNVSIFISTPRSDASCSASRGPKGKTKGGGRVVMEDEIGIDNGDNEDYDDEEEMGDVLPFDKMRAWLRNRPKGFGEGKTYDLSLEDELMEEIERSRKAQLANINKLKNNAVDVDEGAKKIPKHSKVNEVQILPDAVRVRIGNLPRKKNIRRDLQSAFSEFSGIINISPANSGNHKTRDPVCKGFAFIDFKSEDTAERFVRMYSNQSLSFGKVEKRITCHVLGSSSSTATARKQNSDDEEVSIISEIDVASLAFSKSNQGSPGNGRQILEETAEISGNPATLSSSNDSELHSGSISAHYSSPEQSQEQSAVVAVSHSTSSQDMSSNSPSKLKGRKDKPKPQKKVKNSVPGSAIRLQVKERNVLSGVFTKYNGKTSSGLEKES